MYAEWHNTNLNKCVLRVLFMTKMLQVNILSQYEQQKIKLMNERNGGKWIAFRTDDNFVLSRELFLELIFPKEEWSAPLQAVLRILLRKIVSCYVCWQIVSEIFKNPWVFLKKVY